MPEDSAARVEARLADPSRTSLAADQGGECCARVHAELFVDASEAALDRLAPVLGVRPAWTKKSRLPGGDFPADGFAQLVAQARQSWPFLSEAHIRRLVHAYGTRVDRVLGAAKRIDDLGPRLGADLTGVEVRYLMDHEWAQTADDVLWRRSKLGLLVSAAEHEQLAKFMANAIGSGA